MLSAGLAWQVDALYDLPLPTWLDAAHGDVGDGEVIMPLGAVDPLAMLD